MHEVVRRPRPSARISVARDGERRFAELAARLPGLLEDLRAATPLDGGATGAPVSAGVYLLSEGPVPLYVGQTRNLQRRVREHGGATSRENQAPFAFNLAKEEAAGLGIDVGRPRRVLEADPRFAALFGKARSRVAAMDVRFVAIEDPETRTVLEVYAAIVLGTSRYNSFETR